MQWAKIFSYYAIWYFVQATISFALQKFFSFMSSQKLINGFSLCANAVLFTISFPVSSRLFPNFSSIIFNISGFMLRPLINLELSFMLGHKYRSICILLQADIQFHQDHLLKMLCFFPSVYFCLLFKTQVPIGMWTYVWGFSFLHSPTCMVSCQYHAVFNTTNL